MANQGIMHWRVGDQRVACNVRRAIMYLPFEEFMSYPWRCKRCLKKAELALELQRRREEAAQ